MNKVRKYFAWILWRTKISAFLRNIVASKGRFVLEFHDVSRTHYSNIPKKVQPSLTRKELEKILSWIQKRFQFLTPTEFMKYSKNGVLLTFDDGFANNFLNVIPLLNEFNAPAILFISAQHVLDQKDWLPSVKNAISNYWKNHNEIPKELSQDLFDGMTEDMVANAAKNPLITIGSHTITHPFLTRCTDQELSYELEYSKKYLEGIARQKILYFAYPAGNYDKRVIQFVKSAGYKAAFVEDSLKLGDPIFEIPRIGVYSSDEAYLSLKLSGLHRKPLKNKMI